MRLQLLALCRFADMYVDDISRFAFAGIFAGEEVKSAVAWNRSMGVIARRIVNDN